MKRSVSLAVALILLAGCGAKADQAEPTTSQLPDTTSTTVVDEASTDLLGSTRDIARVLAFAENIVSELGEDAAPMMQRLRGLANQPGALADAAAGHLVADASTRRQLLECLSQDQRIKAVADELARLDAQRKLDEQGGGEEVRGLN